MFFGNSLSSCPAPSRRHTRVLMVGVEDERYPAGWAKVRSSSELVAVMRGPTFRLGTENIWIARGDQTFRGELPVDDPALTEAFRRQRQESPAGP